MMTRADAAPRGNNPSCHIADRSAIDAMTAEFIEKHGAVRRFDAGFSGNWDALRSLMEGAGYDMRLLQGVYYLKRSGAPGKGRRFTRLEILDAIDAVLIESGREPLKRRAA